MTVNGPTPVQLHITEPSLARSTAPDATPPPALPHAPKVAAGAPDGVNPELWSVLTIEERTFFVQNLDLGSLTYGPTRAAPTRVDAPRGQRIDVRA